MDSKILLMREHEKYSQPMPTLIDTHRADLENTEAMSSASHQDTLTAPLNKTTTCNESVSQTKTLSATDASSLHFHIRVLYSIIACLTIVLVPSLIFCQIEITSLRDALSHQQTVNDQVEFTFPISDEPVDALQMPYFPAEDELSLGGFWEGEQAAEDSATKVRTKRRARDEGSGAADDWLWMSSFARVPIVALQSYCREAQLYCAAAGKPGPPGSVGPKGETGEKGEKGDANTGVIPANIEDIRGLPGPKGDKGSDGLPGPVGPKGEPGDPGTPGEKGSSGYAGPVGEPGPRGEQGPPGLGGDKGAKGDRGPAGPPGERGMSGLPGVPGLKGLHGDTGLPGTPGEPGLPGLPGVDGRPGYCQAECVDVDRTRTFTETTTPPPTFPPRTKECSVEIVGVPVFLREASHKQGSWMKDFKPASSKVWVTYGIEGSSIVEYSSFENFKTNKVGREIRLTATPYYGTGHVVYDGHFYYQWAGSPKLVRFDLTTGQVTTVRSIPDLVHTASRVMKSQGFLYQSQTMFAHFNVDQNGLWVIYANERTHNISVALLNPETLDIIKSVDTTLELASKGGAFIACGKVYTLKHFNRQRSSLDEEHDLWYGQVRRIKINFNNPYSETYTLAYDHNNNHFLTWDGGRLLSTPMLIKTN